MNGSPEPRRQSDNRNIQGHSLDSKATKASSPPVPGVASRSIELDFLRGMAILLVMCAHFSVPPTYLIILDWPSETLKAVGGVGVNLFFALSGFLVGGLLLKEYQRTRSIRPWRFLARRAFKIWPPFYALILFHAIIGHHDRSTFLWQSLLQVQNYFGTSISQTWSLAVEEHFYLILTVLLVMCVGKTPRFIISLMCAISAVTIVLRVLAVNHGMLGQTFRETHFRIDSLLYGVILAAVSIFYPHVFLALAKQRFLLVLSVIALCIFITVSVDNPVIDRDLGYAVQGIGFSLLLTLVYTGSGALVRQFWYRGIAWLGIYSYGVYLWHTLALAPGKQLMDFMARNNVPPTIVWFTVGTAQMAIAVTVGVVMTRVVEWPSLTIRERLLGADRNQIGTEASTKVS